MYIEDDACPELAFYDPWELEEGDVPVTAIVMYDGQSFEDAEFRLVDVVLPILPPNPRVEHIRGYAAHGVARYPVDPRLPPWFEAEISSTGLADMLFDGDYSTDGLAWVLLHGIVPGEAFLVRFLPPKILGGGESEPEAEPRKPVVLGPWYPKGGRWALDANDVRCVLESFSETDASERIRLVAGR